MPGPDLYTYLDYRQFLRDWFEAKKAADPAFSHRAFARRAKVASPSLLKAVIDGKRNLTPGTTDAFADAVGLGLEESEFFGVLVHFAQAETLEDRNRAWERVRAVRRFREARHLADEGIQYLSCWYYPAIRELAGCDGFQSDPEWIAATLRPTIPAEEARRALEVLEALGLLSRDAGGTLRPSEATVVTAAEVRGMAASNYHLGMIDRARAALTAVPSAERHFCALTVAVSPDLVPRLKREISAFQERLLDLCDGAEAPRELVYQVNLQLVPLSHRSTADG